MGLSVMSMMTFCWEECYVPNHRPLPAPESCRCPLAHPSIQFGEVAASQMKWCHSYTGDPLELDSMVFFEEFNPTLVITNFKVISFHYQTVSNVQGLVALWQHIAGKFRLRQDTLHRPSQRRCWHNPRGQIDIPGDSCGSIQPFHP